MQKIIILGITGMLGSKMLETFQSTNKYKVYFTSRNKKNFNQSNHIHFDVLNQNINFDFFKDADYIINCIGVTKPFINKNIVDSIYINSIFSHKLSDFCEKNKIKFIHITTDCVFSGNEGEYQEDCLHDCIDIYGKSKSLGEPDNCMVIRTSIIGIEKTNFVHLLSWVISQKGKSVNGFLNHLWNGVTTNYLSNIVEDIISRDLYEQKLFHVHSPKDITKYELLKIINNKFNLKLNINPINASLKINRTLRSKNKLTSQLCTLNINEQINNL
tara:strand:+ start:480 stop:1295 length:816 start_codon:yes stop_codon:yes gene_type:complete